MPDYVLIQDSDDLISRYAGCAMSESGCRLVDVDAQSITGDALPPTGFRNLMVGGEMTTGFVYTEQDLSGLPDYVDRDRAYEEAMADWVENGTMADDTKWKRCVKSGCSNHLNDTDWAALIAAYPA